MTTITIDQLVQREVIYCVSSLVSELAKSEKYSDDLAPVLYGDDWQSAAIDNGWNKETMPEISAENYCRDADIDTYQLEFYEHWIVSSWLADKLEAHGEKVVRDFFGIGAIWGRQCTGQAIALDSVIEDIHQELVKYRRVI